MTAAASSADAAAHLTRLELHDVRLFAEACLDVVPDATTILTGPNGTGKTTFLEAAAFLGSQRSFRTATRDAMIRSGEERAIIRAELLRDTRPLLVEAELEANGSARTLVNHKRLHGRADLADAVPVTVFSPEDLGLVQGPPARRRDLLDAVIRLLDRRAAADIDAMDRVLRQRAALLRQAAGKLTPEVAATLDVWDERLALHGAVVSTARSALVVDASPIVARAYADLGGETVPHSVVTLRYVPGWSGELEAALGAARRDDVRRAASTVGPHRDEVLVQIDGREARSRASQGEQRSIALALRLALHRLVTERRGGAPLLLLDDVFSELDPGRSRALVRNLPPGQSLVTTASALPDGISVGAVIDVSTVGRRA